MGRKDQLHGDDGEGRSEEKERRGSQQWNCDEGRALIWIVGSIRGKDRAGLRGSDLDSI